jgi:hypothetical protein
MITPILLRILAVKFITKPGSMVLRSIPEDTRIPLELKYPKIDFTVPITFELYTSKLDVKLATDVPNNPPNDKLKRTINNKTTITAIPFDIPNFRKNPTGLALTMAIKTAIKNCVTITDEYIIPARMTTEAAMKNTDGIRNSNFSLLMIGAIAPSKYSVLETENIKIEPDK